MKDGKLGCGGLIAIILLVFAFLNDFASELGGAFQFFFWIGIIIIIVAVVKFMIINEKRTYICIKLDLQQKDLCKKMHNIFPTYDILEICWQKGEVHHAEGNKSEI